MLNSFAVTGFKSLSDLERVRLAPLTLLFGPNAAGKSNFIDALQVLSRIATANTLNEALGPPVRGLPLEAFTLPQGGLAEQLKRTTLESYPRIRFAAETQQQDTKLSYEIEVAIAPPSGTLSVQEETLRRLTAADRDQGRPIIELDETRTKIRVRRKSKPAHPWEEPVGLNHSLLSNNRYSGKEYAAIEGMRNELRGFRSYFLDPRTAMRSAQPPQDVSDIGPLGEHIAPFLYRLRSERKKSYDAVRRAVRALIPSVEDLTVDLDPRRGVLDVEIRQHGISFSSRVASEGTLRVLALACVAVNPWPASMVAFEEPENGVHPRRVELIAQVLESIVGAGSAQVVVTTHSPLLCGAFVRMARKAPDMVRIYRVTRAQSQTRFHSFEPAGPLFDDPDIAGALTATSEDAVIEGALLRGLLDG